MLVDTSVWIDYFNGHASPEADRLAQAITDNEPIILCGIVMTEILLGLRSDAEAGRIAEILDVFDMTPEPDRVDYCEAAALYRRCRSKGYTIRSTIDCLIAQLTRSATSPAVQGGFGARGRRSRPWVSVRCLLLFDVLAHEGDRRTATG